MPHRPVWIHAVPSLVAWGLLGLPAVAEEAAESAEMVGVVRDEAGEPVPGARVFIHTAGPREGFATYCPGCYPDCRKRTAADADGRFRIEELDPTLRFRVLFVADGYEAKFQRIDPADGAATVALAESPPPPTGSHRTLTGRVVDENGNPVPGAAVSPRGYGSLAARRKFDGAFTWTSAERFMLTPVAVTDDAGRFTLITKEPTAALDLDVSAPLFAETVARGVTVPADDGDPDEPTLTLAPGVTATGAVTYAGEPVPGVRVGVVQADRGAGDFVGESLIATDADGRFLLPNLPPNQSLIAYVKGADLAAAGLPESAAPPVVPFDGPADGEVRDLGTLTVSDDGVTIGGRVTLTGGGPLPDGVRVQVSAEDAWDSRIAPVGRDGRWRVAGLKPGLYDLSVGLRGYRLSRDNASLAHGGMRLTGRVERDRGDLEIAVEPGRFERNPAADWEALRTTPLRGAEAVDEASP